MSFKNRKVSIQDIEFNKYKLEIKPLESGAGYTIGHTIHTMFHSLGSHKIIDLSLNCKNGKFPHLGLKESYVEISLNFNQLFFTQKEERKEYSLTFHKAGEYYTNDILCNNLQCINKSPVYLFTKLDDNALVLNWTVQYGEGVQTTNKLFDICYSPVYVEDYKISPSRVKDNLNYECLIVILVSHVHLDVSQLLNKLVQEFYQALNTLISEDLLSQIDDSYIPIEEIKSNSLLSKPIEILNISDRSVNCLIQEGISIIGDLISKTEGEIIKIPHLGNKCLHEIKEALLKNSLHLKEEI